jgi:hypothetical protein
MAHCWLEALFRERAPLNKGQHYEDEVVGLGQRKEDLKWQDLGPSANDSEGQSEQITK